MAAQSKVAQYAIWYNGTVIEHTGYIATLAAAKKFVRARYGNGPGLQVQAVYPTLDPVKHEVN